MAAPTFTITQGDRSPALSIVAKDAAGATVDFTAATSVAFTMRDHNAGTAKVSAQAAAFGSPRTGGVLTYAWGATDTDTVGAFDGKFTVTWNDATKTSWPTNATATDNYIVVNVVDDAGTVG